jgi:hypothetical protein
MFDIRVSNHGSVCLLHPLNAVGQKWLEENIIEPVYFGAAFACDPRYVFSVVDGACAEGLEVQIGDTRAA